MDKNEAKNQLKQITRIMDFTEYSVLRKAAWYFILQGSGWIVTSTSNQFFPHIAPVLNLIVGIIAVILCLVITLILFGDVDSKVRMQKFKFKFLMGISATILFIISLFIMLELKQPKQFALVLALTISFGFMLTGVLKHIHMFVLGLLLLINTYIAFLFFNEYFLTYLGDSFGIIYIVFGIYFLFSGRKK